MLYKVHKKLLLIGFLLSLWPQAALPLSSYSRHDAYPMFTALDPHIFLYTYDKLEMKGCLEAHGPCYEPYGDKTERVGLSISPFGQNADWGKSSQGKRIAAGNVDGRWNMIGLLFGQAPTGKILPASLVNARNALFPGGAADGLNNPNVIDPNHNFGFFSFPSKYRKRGMRFELQANLLGDFGVSIQAGVADICLTVTEIDNRTCNTTGKCGFRITGDCSAADCHVDNYTNLTRDNVNDYLMDELKTIAREVCLDISNFHEVSAEEVRFNLYWRHGFEINRDEDCWPEFLLIPYFTIGGSISPGKKKDYNQAFALSFGNNDHNAIGFTSGINFDFCTTIEIGAEIGLTHFFKKDFCNFRVPNNESQLGIYPFTTDVSIHPGQNWHFGAKFFARHFLDNLSFYFQYLQVQHRDDRVCLCNPDNAFKPEALEKNSSWKTKMANIGFAYDLSPNLSLSFLWQAPISQRGAFRSTTVLFTFNASY